MFSKRIMPWVIGLTSCALVGLILLQAYLLANAYELKEQAFSRNVSSALLAASMRIQAGETLTQVFRVSSEKGQGVQVVATAARLRGACDTLPPLTRTATRNRLVRRDGRSASYSYSYSVQDNQTVSVQSDSIGPRDSVGMVVRVIRGGDTDTVVPVGRTGDSGLVVPVERAEDDATILPLTLDSARSVFVARIVDNLRSSDSEPLNERVNPVTLDSILHVSMQEAGITLGFAWGVLTKQRDGGQRDSIQMPHPFDAAPALLRSPYHTALIPLNPLAGHEQLVVDFPGHTIFVLGQIWPAFAASCLFIVLIVLAFVYTVRTIFMQQRLATHMVDFVNTMTHEFKTPLSTVTLATEAITRPDVVGKKQKVLQYSGMIADEAARMKAQVDRILQMAQLEDGELELKRAPLGMHELVTATASSFALQVEARGGSLVLNFTADDDRVEGDTVHLGNVLRSVLDNANKYSPAAPAITIRSLQHEGRFVLEISDRGMGIPQEHLRRVFDKFYRVPTGNVHDVKGFGIGLSYVKLLVEAHGGTVTLASTLGEGTTVTLELPLSRPET